jgi:hypothetical protein
MRMTMIIINSFHILEAWHLQGYIPSSAICRSAGEYQVGNG